MVSLVTGVTGVLGLALVKHLAKERDVYCLVHTASARNNLLPSTDNVHVLESNLLVNASWQKLVVPQHIDEVYHLAWQGARGRQSRDEVVQLKNMQMAQEAAQFAALHGAKVFIGAGSQAEYGALDTCLREDMVCSPDTVYGKAKLLAQQTTASIAAQYGMRHVWTRFFSLYGPYDDTRSFISSLLRKALRNEPLALTLGLQAWDYLHVDDAAAAMVALAQDSSATGVYNVAEGTGHTLSWYVETLVQIIGSMSERHYGAVNQGAILRHRRPDIAKIKATGIWQPRVDFAVGLKDLVHADGLRSL